MRACAAEEEPALGAWLQKSATQITGRELLFKLGGTGVYMSAHQDGSRNMKGDRAARGASHRIASSQPLLSDASGKMMTR